MALLVGVGQNQGKDSYEAGLLACQEAVHSFGENVTPDALIVFSSVAFDQTQMLKGVRSVAPDALLVGCSTSGEITTNGPSLDQSVAVMALRSDTLRFSGAIGEYAQAGAREAGQRVAKMVLEQFGENKPQSFLMFPDVLAANGSEVLAGVLDVLGQHFPVVGGAAGDDFQFKKTYQYFNGTVYSKAVVGLGVAGKVKAGIGVRHGWAPIGRPMKVTKSEGAVVHEIDGKPAIEVYDEYFGKYADELRKETLGKLAITYPLGIKTDESDEFLVRDPLSVDEYGSITCAADVPQDAEVRLMIGSRDEALAMAKRAANRALEQLDGAKPKAAIIFNCIARKKLFGETSGDEIDAIQEVIGRDVPLVGFYTYGEQAPLEGEARNIERCNATFHNETIVIYLLAE
jgi:hypothetical protein